MKKKFNRYIEKLQDRITQKLSELDGKAHFKEDFWERSDGGGGRTRVIENGAVFEKGGVNISAVNGELPDSMKNYFKVKAGDFFACGLSLVIHPKNPFVPTVHANWRYFELYSSKGELQDQWFGGGQDLTPYYLFEEDARHFHQICKKTCDEHDKDFYPLYKKRCDEYFWNAHRGEARGVGGLFFDYLRPDEKRSAENWYQFVTGVGDSFLEAYVPIVEKRKTFELLRCPTPMAGSPKGTLCGVQLDPRQRDPFGLKTNGRIESILMSLPPHVQWQYNHKPDPNSKEEELVNVLENPRAWV